MQLSFGGEGPEKRTHRVLVPFPFPRPPAHLMRLQVIKGPIKSGNQQLKALYVLEVFVNNCNLTFALEVLL